jgi:hypothetical protein
MSLLRNRPRGGPAVRRSACIAAALGALAAPATAHVQAGPSSDRTIKWCLGERLAVAPRLIVLGSSRAMKIDPAYLRSKSGLPGFNAGVSGAGLIDVWAFTNFLHDRFPGTPQHALWLVDVEQFRQPPSDRAVLGTPGLARYLSPSLSAADRARAAIPVPCSFRTSATTRYSPLGLRTHDIHDAARSRGETLADGLRRSVRDYTELYGRFGRLSPDAERWFERTLATLNSWDDDPVVVLTPAHPAFLASLGPVGWNRRHDELVRYLKGLAPRYRFHLLDASRIATFGGRRSGFYDGVHQTQPNVRALLDWIDVLGLLRR